MSQPHSAPVPGGTHPRADVLAEPLWETCPLCIEHFYGEGSGLLHAFASVGIELGKSQFEMAATYFEQYHKLGHKDVKR